MLIKILILLFIIIIFYEIFNDSFNQYEGFDTSNDPMVLSQKNAGQILLLNDQYNSQTKSINDIKNYITKLFENVETLNNQVNALKSNK
jgi:predicted transglutaminase-like cysteine proteinase